ncbi:MAG: hypothetical protein HGA97_12905, partial [Chlorobiaceae bacterium]|nr:hypothetical protein [Chlorobiaceae bacterium]
MKKSLFPVAAGFAGMLFCAPLSNAQANLTLLMSLGIKPQVVVVNNYPDFIYLDDYGFYVSLGWEYDVIRYGDLYFIFRDGGWFRSMNLRGPWSPVGYQEMPQPIRWHNWNDIRNRRDQEYRNHDQSYWDKHFREQRLRDGRDERDRKSFERPDQRPQPQDQPQGRPDQRPQPQDQPQGRPDQRPQPQDQPQGRPDQ